MGCVNRSSKEFKDLATRNNVDINKLELITHKYWLQTGNETLFPTDVYIQAQLGNTHYQEDGKSVRKLWELRYKSPKEFNSKGALDVAKREAMKFFPGSAIVHYKNAKGNYVLSVKRPVEKANYTKDDFFKEMDNMGSMRDVKTLDLGIEKDKSYSIEKVQELYNRFNTDRTSKDLADRVFSAAKDLGLTITFDESLPFGNVGRYTNDNTIRFKKSFLERDIMNNKKAPIILHEAIHALSMYALSKQTANWKRPETLEQFRTEMNSLYQDLKNHPMLKGERGIVDLHEFVAELANPVFRGKLQEIDKQNNENRSFWSRVLDAFKSLLGLHTSHSYYQRSMNALDKALDAFDMDTYMRFNGAKNQLRQGYNAKEWEFNSMSDKEIKAGVTNYFDKQTNTKLGKEFIDSMSGKDLKDELSLIKQEYADYDLVNGIEEEKKHSSRAVPHDFTFADGTTVKAPFKPNAQQIDALNAMDAFMKSKETTMTLSGYAGTGKTSLMEMIAKKGQRQHRPVKFCATTNKAAAVLNDRVAKAGFQATTLNKTFGIGVEMDDNSKTYDARNVISKLKNDNQVNPGDTVIIDEASMINEENYDILNNVAKELHLKIIYVGDSAQLPPVKENKISKVFRNGDGKVITLTQVERTDDNAILKEATALRNDKTLSGESSFNSKGEGVAYLSPQHQEAIGEVIEKYVKKLKSDPNYFRILAYTNKAVTDYNNQVRNLLGYNTPTPHAGEPMTGYASWGYVWSKKGGHYRFINSEAYKVTDVAKPKKITITLDNGVSAEMEATPITLEDSLGNVDTFDFMDIKDNLQNRQAATIIGTEKKNLWSLYMKTRNKDILSKINALDNLLFLNDDLEDANAPIGKNGKRPLLVKKVIDFGYAMTVHKSQGSTFTHVLMDDVDISRANMQAKPMQTIELEDTPMDMSNIEVKNEESNDLGDLGSEETTSTTPKEETNLRQQLEYVGVSRATDTVTIISNNIKKEGSPLHPEKNIKDDTINKENPRSNSNNNNNGTEEYKTTDEFRRVQEAVRGSSKKESSGQSIFTGYLTPDQRQRLANVLGRQLGSIDSFIHGSSRTVDNQKHGTSFKVHSEVSPQLFHDIFEVVRYYTKNAELVDLHDDYSNCKCFLTEDGTAGFAIEDDGNLVSVFNLGTTKGFLSAVKDMVREAGATHLDAYASSKQNLQLMYEKTLGFHTASTMDYNMEYDHDDIAKNHDNPQVVFMVDHEVAEPKHFDKDSYDAAQQYQLEQLPKKFSDVFQSPVSSEVEVEDVMKPWRNDLSKSNKSRRVYLKGQKNKGYFEVVLRREVVQVIVL